MVITITTLIVQYLLEYLVSKCKSVNIMKATLAMLFLDKFKCKITKVFMLHIGMANFTIELLLFHATEYINL